MTELGMQSYWNSRVTAAGNYGTPLVLSEEEVDFHRQHLVAGGDTLVLGATPVLCTMALEESRSVTSVDFAQDIVDRLRIDGVRYECMDWAAFFAGTTDHYDTILTDGGLLCLDFPNKWAEIVSQISSHLNPDGIFGAKFYISREEPPKASDTSPSINRFMTIQPREGDNWMVTPTHPDYADFDLQYALPPETEVHRIFGQLALVDSLVPAYEAGEYFPSYVWKKV